MMNLFDKELTARKLMLNQKISDIYSYVTITPDGFILSNEPYVKTRTVLPKRYIINDGAIVLFWDDGTKTIVKRAKDDTDDVVKGFLWAYFEKMSGMSKTQANKYLKDIASSRSEVEVI